MATCLRQSAHPRPRPVSPAVAPRARVCGHSTKGYGKQPESPLISPTREPEDPCRKYIPAGMFPHMAHCHNEGCMPNRALVVGVGMEKFATPGRRRGWGYPQMTQGAGTPSLNNAGVNSSAIQTIFAANVTAARQHNIGPGGAAVVTAYQKVER